MAETLTFSGTQWLWIVVAAIAAAGGILWWSYAASRGSPLRWVCLALKTCGLLALAVCLLEPLWLGRRPKPGANLVAVVADNSQGLQVRDNGDTRSRGDRLRELVGPSRPWQAVLATNFDVRRYLFDARVQATTDFHELAFDGRATALGAALRGLRERFHDRPLAGIVLLTDGNATDLPAGMVPDATGLPPIYPVVIGRPDPIGDVAVQRVQISQSSFEDAPVAIQAEVSAPGFRGRPIVARLVDRQGKVVQQQINRTNAEADPLSFRFQLKPERAGLSFYQVSVRAQAELDRDAASERTAEATLANNQRVVSVDRGQGPFRVLYVSGRPNWEFKFLNRAVQADDQVELVGLIRVAKREPKFDFRGHAGETSNPLFRGFGSQSPEEVERYDQPVLVRLNTRDETELRTGFPRTPEELYAYHAVILDHVEAEFFAPEQAQLLQKFVSERGGGFVMLGGMESFANGNYLRTPIGDMLPVYLDAADPGVELPLSEVHLQLGREGWLQPWARLRDNEADERTRLAQMPAFDVVNRVRALKPGASLIAAVRDAQGTEYPALAVQRFGRGRTAALMVGDLWRWGMRDEAAHADMDKAWRQLVRWLVSDVPARVQCTVESAPAEEGNAMRVLVRVRDETFQPIDDASVVIEVEPIGFGAASTGNVSPIKLEAEPALTEPGLYQTTYVPRQTGGYRAVATVKSGDGRDLGRAEAGWSSDLAADEFRSLTPNVSLLQDLAQKTGGRILRAEELEDFARSLSRQAAPIMETWTYPAWHSPVLFAFALACIVAEWALRRWKGLP